MMLNDDYFKGAAWFQWAGPDRQLPVLAITFNHRREAFYRAWERDESRSGPLQSTQSSGLRDCRMLASHTPGYLVKALVHIHNMSHTGSGWSMWDALDHALELECEWSAYASEKGISAAHACYPQLLY